MRETSDLTPWLYIIRKSDMSHTAVYAWFLRISTRKWKWKSTRKKKGEEEKSEKVAGAAELPLLMPRREGESHVARSL